MTKYETSKEVHWQESGGKTSMKHHETIEVVQLTEEGNPWKPQGRHTTVGHRLVSRMNHHAFGGPYQGLAFGWFQVAGDRSFDFTRVW